METRGRGRTEGGFLEEGVRAGVGGGGGDAHCHDELFILFVI